MRVIIILSAIAFAHGAKLERTYLPPSNARTAGGSGTFLQAPVSRASSISRPGSNAASTYQGAQTGFLPSGNGFIQPANGFAPSGNEFAQTANGFAQTGAEYNNVNFNYANEARSERPRAAFERNAAILRQDNSNDGETYSYAFETENGIYAEESGVATNGVEAQGGYSYTGDDGQVYSVRYTADQNGFVPQGDHLPTPPPVPEDILKALEQNARDEAAGIYDDGTYNEGKYAAADNNNYNNQNSYQQNNAYNGNDDTVVTNSALTRSGNAPSYNARNGPAYNIPSSNSGVYNTANNIAPTYGAPAQNGFNTASIRNGPPLNAPANNVPSYNAPTGNTPSYNALANNAPSYNAPAINAPSYNALNAASRNAASTATEKAYLPPFADQRDQAKNGFGRRQQSFDAKTGYKY